MNKELEIWKPIKGYEGYYEVSSFGNVKRVRGFVFKGKTKAKSFQKEKIIKGSYNKRGYRSVCLSKDNIVKTHSVHQLVAITFLNHIPNGLNLVIDHIDNNKLNNRVDNLQIVTHRFNNQKDKLNKTGFIGVKKTKFGKFEAKLRINKIMVHLGNFEVPEMAQKIYYKAINNIDKFNGNPKEFRMCLINN